MRSKYLGTIAVSPFVYSVGRKITTLCAFLFIMLISTVSFAQDFTAKALGDYGNVTVMEVTGNYDAYSSSTTVNDGPRQIISKEFFKTHKDEYDFLVIFSNFDFQMPDEGTAKGFYLPVKNDIQGLGQELFDNSSYFGSSARLQGILEMGNTAQHVTDPLDPRFEDTLYMLSHELMHRWGAYAKLKNASGTLRDTLLGKDGLHWSYLFGAGSVLYGNQWQGNGNSTFMSLGQGKSYSPLDLYLMGMIDKSKVPPMFLIDNPDIDPARLPQAGDTISGTSKYVTIDDIIASNGQRVPNVSVSQKNFKTAFIFITQPGAFTKNELYGMENIRNSWITRFSILTDGKSVIEVVPSPKDDIPLNPGISIVPATPRTLPPNINDGVQWLIDHQKADGTWDDLTQTPERDTAVTTLALKSFSAARQNYLNGIQWLGQTSSGNADFLSRKIMAFVGSDQNAAASVTGLVSRQNTDGGWGGENEYNSNPSDTAFALKAFSEAGYSDPGVTGKAIGYLKTHQNADGGWGSENKGGMVQETSNVLLAFSAYRTSYQLQNAIALGTAWLIGKQNADGGFGNSPSTVYDTAIATLALLELNVSADITFNALSYVFRQQSDNGSWNQSAYQTALAVSAVYKATVSPDLSIKAEDISIIPTTIKSLPSAIVINANIGNLGRTAVPQARVVLYNGDPVPGNIIAEQTLAFPGQASTTVTFSSTAKDGNEHAFTIVVDPDNVISEANKLNNKAFFTLTPEATYDFEVLPGDITVSANSVDLLQTVKVVSHITNKGTLNAYNVQVKYLVNDAAAPFDIATTTVDIPAGATITNEISWRVNKVGVSMPLAVQADPFNNFTELSKTNNIASIPITVNADTRPNVSVSYNNLTISPSPGLESGSATISALVRNDGVSAVSDVVVNFYQGILGANGLLIGSKTIPLMNANDNAAVFVDWTDIQESGERIITVEAHPKDPVSEIRDDDNAAFTKLTILSLPDLAISTNSIVFAPPAPKENDPITITVNIQNAGDQTVSGVFIKVYDNEAEIGSRITGVIPGHGLGTATMSSLSTLNRGLHQIRVVVDPDNAIRELSKTNNSAVRSLGVQNSNLWVTEQYFSPNGDGMKDNTQLFFRFDVPQNVKVAILNKKKEAVRTFNGPELTNISGASVIWDGLNNEGMVVPDGEYSMQLRKADGSFINSISVTVDTNSSSLIDSFGTKYLLNNNLSCMPDIAESNWRWFPDESGILFLASAKQNTPEYPYGLYTMAPDGQDIVRIVPAEWSAGLDPVYDFAYVAYDMTSDGEKIAFVLDKNNKMTGITELSQIWVMDRDGSRMVLLDSYDEASNIQVLDLKWAPQGNYLVYRIQNGNGPEELRFMNPDGTGKAQIDSGGYFDFNILKWSPDNQQLAYVFGSYYDSWHFQQQIRLADIAGNKRDLFSIGESDNSSYVESIEWLDFQKIAMVHYSWSYHILSLLDAGGNDNHIFINYVIHNPGLAVAPDKRSFAFVNNNIDWGGSSTISVVDTDGNISVPHTYTTAGEYCWPKLGSILWSPDSKKIVFSEGTETCGDCPPCQDAIGPHVITMNVQTQQETSVASGMHPAAWLSDGVSVSGYNILDKYGDTDRVCSLNTNTNALTCNPILSDARIYSDKSKYISPRERYIMYHQNVPPSSVCSGRGSEDVWAISSLMNLTGQLWILRGKSALTLKGVAADLNFDGYQLEYADIKSPENWQPVAPPASVPVVNDAFTTWVPPYEGVFYVRLTVRDKAGNMALSRQRISWGSASSITNLYKTLDIFSPNGDGANDIVELHYKTLEPVHLEFNVYDEQGMRVRSFLKNHTMPGDYFISWDGRDDSAEVVPDGNYIIRVFDYDFFVEVDSTPPRVHVSFSAIAADNNINDAVMYELLLKGYADDKNIREWVVEYGVGDNPEEWHELRRGGNALARTDEQNAIITPIQDADISRYVDDEIGLFKGCKIRLSALDYAGNRSSAVSDMIDGAIKLYKWDNRPTKALVGGNVLTDYIVVDRARPGSHTITGFDTVQARLVRMLVQYRRGLEWVDSEEVPVPSSGPIVANWDSSSLNGEDGLEVRLKAFDSAGRVYYSNSLSTGQSNFSLTNKCYSLIAYNVLPEQLSMLKFQVWISGRWTDYKIYDAAKGDRIPIEKFDAPLPDILQTEYDLQMVGTDITGISFYSEPKHYPGKDCLFPGRSTLETNVHYDESECGKKSSLAVISAEHKIEGAVFPENLKTLAFYAQKPEGPQLLREFDLTREPWGNVHLNTTLMTEGTYSVTAVLHYFDPLKNQIETAQSSRDLIVDRVSPEARISYPDKNAVLCPLKKSDASGDWYGIAVEGEAIDNAGVNKYVLYYGVGDNPASWLPAMTRENGKAALIQGAGSHAGQIGLWDVTNIKGVKGEVFSLKLEVADNAGNKSCTTTSFSLDSLIEVSSFTADHSVISPNSDGLFDGVELVYDIGEYATVDGSVFNTIKTIDESIVPEANPIRILASGLQHVSGREYLVWDGKSDTGGVAPDGRKVIVLKATDSCGNTTETRTDIVVDNSAPAAEISFPRAGSSLGNVVEIKGTSSDVNFMNYTLEAGQGDSPASWIPIASGVSPVKDNLLGIWKTYGLAGRWTLRLTTRDAAANMKETAIAVELGMQKNLIKDVGASPAIFSPNNDGKLDTTNVSYELTDNCDVSIEILDSFGLARRTSILTGVAAGTASLRWDGTDSSGTVLPDGIYTFKFTAGSTSNSSITQTEAITIVVDTIAPVIDLTSPKDKSYLSGPDIAVTGTIDELNMMEYSLNYSGTLGSNGIDHGVQPRTHYSFGTLNNIPEGDYTLMVKAKDLAENTANRDIPFTIDRTRPAVKLDAPNDGDFFGASRNAITIVGGIIDKNLESYTLRYALADNPAQLTDIATGKSVPTSPELFSWKVGNADNIPDGAYLLSLIAKDKAGLTGESVVRVTIDNTPPMALITAPQEGATIKSPLDLKGTASDQNFAKYTVDQSDSRCDSAFKWVLIRMATASVQDGVLGAWQALPPDGDYCLRLTVRDKTGLAAEVKINIKVDTHPPAAPILEGKADRSPAANLEWNGNGEPDLSGFNLYKNGQKVNADLITGTKYTDQNAQEGIAVYTVKAVDLAGWESPSSNEVRIRIDLTGPEARVRTPQNETSVSGLIDIKGTAYSADDFKQYRLFTGVGANPSIWSLIRTSPVAMSYGSLAQWDTLGLADGQAVSFKLEAEDVSGNVSTHQISVTIDNAPPRKPVILSAIGQDATATITWNANIESDLAGYLLYRNDQPANVPGIAVGDLKPYLIAPGAATSLYIDRNLPDGTFKYYIAAMDKAGNISDPSDISEVSIDTHAPHATIDDPVDGATFGIKIFIKAASVDLDIASVQFQYQSAQDGLWTNLSGFVTNGSMVGYLDPGMLGLGYGAYHLRAVATDKGHKIDPSPAFITINFADLTPPASPQGITSKTIGADVILTWSANGENDLDGYNVYRTVGGMRTQINAFLITPVPQPTYYDNGLLDGTYEYDITAVDKSGNESEALSYTIARVYAPVVTQPYTPTGQSAIQIKGGNIGTSATVTVFIDTATGMQTFITDSIDSAGTFTVNAVLSLGENRITARAADSAGKVSRDADTVVVVYNDAPGTPTGLVADIQGYAAHLTWNPNAEADIFGYDLFRNGVKVNASDAAVPVQFTTSSYVDPYDSWMAMDATLDSWWRPLDGVSMDNPAWWEMDMAYPELISHVELHWSSEIDGSGNEILYAGKDYEVQVWSGYAWITQATVRGNMVKDNVFDFKPSYRTDRIRIHITDTTDPTSVKQVRLAEVNVIKDNPILIPDGLTPVYDDLNLPDKQYDYALFAIDAYGFVSSPSDTVSVIVGDIVPPSAPQDLTATAENYNVILQWSIGPENDIAGYNIYRATNQGWNKVNAAIVGDTLFADINLVNGNYQYRIAAIDNTGNESAPSTEAAATVNAALLASPDGLVVASTPEGELNLSWTCNAGAEAGYNLYRSTSGGGPYSRINTSQITANSYLDTGLTNNVTYYYVVAAVDAAGNAGMYSPEASGMSFDNIAPLKPVINFPTSTGNPITLQTEKLDIIGSAELGSSVVLFNHGDFVASTMTQKQENTTVYGIENYGDAGSSLSRDGTSLAYYSDSSYGIRLKTLSTGDVQEIISGAYLPLWSPDAKRIAYMSWYNSQRIGIYDVLTGQSTLLTDDVDSYNDQSSPFWSMDGNKLSFIDASGPTPAIWLKDFTNGTLAFVLSADTIDLQRLSPDGSKIAYTDDSGALSIYNLVDGSSMVVDTTAYTGAFDWAPDNHRLAYISFGAGSGEVVVFDFIDGTHSSVNSVSADWFNLVWSSDGNSLIIDCWDNNTAMDAIWVADVKNTGPMRRIVPELSYVTYLGSTQSGDIAALGQTASGSFQLDVLQAGNSFTYSGITLNPGENVFTVQAMDRAGNKSERSDPVLITFDTSFLPELSATAADIYLYPPYPVAGERMSVNIVVANSSGVDASHVDVLVYVWNALGNLELLKSETLSTLAAGSTALITTTWDSTGKTGNNRLVVVIDPYDQIAESTETNNMTIKDFYATEHVGVSMSTSLDRGSYAGNQNVQIQVTINNSGPAKDGVLQAQVEDENGYPISIFDPQAVSLSYASTLNQNLTWNTGSTFSGEYKVHSVLKDGFGIISENTTTFVITPDMTIQLNEVTDKIGYGSRENVNVSFTVKNAGANYIIPTLQAKVTIVDALGTVLYTDIKTASNLLPGTGVDLCSAWNTGVMLPGDYRAIVEVVLDNATISMKSASFKIHSFVSLTGDVLVTPISVSTGGSAQLAYTIANSGNADAVGYTATISIIDPETQAVMLTYNETFDLSNNSSKSGLLPISTEGFGMKSYVAVLLMTSQTITKNLGSASFIVKDLMPPVITIQAPLSSSTYSTSVPLSTHVVDNASGVDRVEYRIDSGIWTLLQPVDSSLGQYAATWNPASVDDGSHAIGFRAADKAGNVSMTDTISFTVQPADTIPPVLTISALADGSYTNNYTLNMAGTVTDNRSVQSMSINNTEVTKNADGSFSQAISLTAGSNTITTVALDTAGNTTTDIRTIILDQTVPMITIENPSDNSVTNAISTIITGTVDKFVTVSVMLNGGDPVSAEVSGNSFRLAVALDYGQNTLEITATDLAMNSNTIKRTVTFDNEKPLLAVANPVQDITTNRASVTVTGVTDDLTATAVMVSCPSATVGAASYPTATTWQVDITNMIEGVNAVTVIATDQAGNSSIVIRNIIYDITPPAVTIDSVFSPTNLNTQTIHGTMEANSSVNVICQTASIGLVSHPTNSTWQAVLSGMTEGENTFSVSAMDQAGNVSILVKSEIQLDTQPPVTRVTPAAGLYGSGLSVTLVTNETGTIYYTTDGTMPTANSLVYGCPIIVTASATIKYFAVDIAGNQEGINTSAYTVDVTPPTAVIAGTSASPTKRTDTLLSVSGDDVQTYKYQLDIGLLSSETPVSSPIALSGLADGLHKIFVIGKDSAGNWQTEANATTASWLVDTQPPILSISALPDGAFTNDAIMNVAGKAIDNIAVQVVSINTNTITWNADGTFSEAVSLNTGSNSIITMAADTAGNIATDIRIIILDQAVPIVTISSPADNSVTNTAEAIVTGTIDKTATLIVQLNGITILPAVETAATFSYPVTLVYGQNTIQVTATDSAGNTGTAKRTVTLDNVNPVLSVANPAQDVSTSQSTILLQGTVSDIDSTAVTITADGATYAPVIINKAFQQQLSFVEEKTYAIMVTATDAAGNATTVQRNVVYDKTPPECSIDPVKSLTNSSSQVVTGTRESGADISVRCLSAIVGAVSYPTSSAWSVIIADMAEGVNTLNVFSQDLAGNASPAQTATVVLDTHAPTTTVNPAGGTYNTTLSAILTANETAIIYYTVDGTIPSLTSPVYTGPLIVSSTTTLMFFGMDRAGNRESVKSVVYAITSPTHEIATNVTYQGPQFIAQGLPIVLGARLQTAVCRNGDEGEHERGHSEDCDRNVSGKSIVLTIVSGTRTQNCTGKTDKKGKAVCSISSPTLPLGPATVTAAFAGDYLYQASSDSKGVVIFAYLSKGAFIIGEHETTERGQVTFWGSPWSKNNSTKVGNAASSFKGYADATNTAPIACGGSWTAHSGNSFSPPNNIPTYMAVSMTSAISKSGGSYAGTITGIAIVKTNSGYASDPGHAGTGTVVGVLCQPEHERSGEDSDEKQ